MSDLLIRAIDPETKAKLKARAARHGRSLSAEARSILQAELLRPEPEQNEKGLGTLARDMFAEHGFTAAEHAEFERHLTELRAHPWRGPPSFED